MLPFDNQWVVFMKKVMRYYRFFALIFIVSIACDGYEGRMSQEDVVFHTDYLYPIDGALVPCPLVTLKGKILRHTFPGVPNYESLENGDTPETRWVLVIPEIEIQRLALAGYIPGDDIFTLEKRGWVQLIAPHSENDPILVFDKQVVVNGYLGSLVFHVHTPIAIEAVGIYDDE